MTHSFRVHFLLTAALLGGCATQPIGPTALVMPASGKPFEVFAQDQATCKQFANGEAGGANLADLKQFGVAAASTHDPTLMGEVGRKTRSIFRKRLLRPRS